MGLTDNTRTYYIAPRTIFSILLTYNGKKSAINLKLPQHYKSTNCTSTKKKKKIVAGVFLPVGECLTWGFPRAVSHKSSVPYQLLPEASRTARSSQDWGHCMRQAWVSFSKTFCLGQKYLDLPPLSWDMDCLLTLWPLLSFVPLVMVTVCLVFWSLSLS